MDMTNFISEEILDPKNPVHAAVRTNLFSVYALALHYAHPKARKEQILSDASEVIMRAMEQDFKPLIPPKTIDIHPENMALFNKRINYLEVTGQFEKDKDDGKTICGQIKAVKHIPTADVLKFLQYITKKNQTPRPDKGESVLPDNTLNIALAVDGFYGIQPADFKSYVENLKYGSGSDSHLDAVRKVYEFDLLKGLNGSDSAAIVYMALLKIYREYHKEDMMLCLIDNAINKLSSNLETNAQHCISIKESGNECIEKIVDFYNKNVKDIPQIAVKKCKILHETEHKKKKRDKDESGSRKAEKRGRPKNMSAKEDEKEIEKKRPRTVTPPKTENDEDEKEVKMENDDDQ